MSLHSSDDPAGSAPATEGRRHPGVSVEADGVDRSHPQGAAKGRPLDVRPLRTHEDYRACVSLQRETWGERFTEVVPSTILQISQRVGGVAAGAFDSTGRLLGFVFGITGLDPAGRKVHWSDMLAVRDGFRNLGIGRMLKDFQRALLEARGVEEILWTFDPLVARNAHLNLVRLGTHVVEYVPDMYGVTDSPLHQGMGTDRFVVSWPIGEATRRPRPPQSHGGPAPPLMNPIPAGAPGTLNLAPARSGAPLVRVQIPPDIEEVQRTSLDRAAAWRLNTRTAITALLDMGYRVEGFKLDEDTGGASYVLASPGSLGIPRATASPES